METSSFRKTCQDAIEHFGAKQQLAVVKEELAELIVAISHYERGRDCMKIQLAEETADVIICLQQLIIAADIGTLTLTQIERKTKRLNELISKK